MKTAFMIMPFGKTPEQKSYWHDIYDHIFKKVLRDAQYEVLRADEIGHQGNITAGILKLLWSSDLVVADLSTCNPNVFYELGIRHALRKHGTILVCAHGESLPFDITNYQVSFYETSIGAAERFKVDFRKRVEAASRGEASDSPVFDFLQDELATLNEKLARARDDLAKLQGSVQMLLHRLVNSSGKEINLFIAENLIPMFGASGTMLERLAKIRFELAIESGVLLPAVRIRDEPGLSDDVYTVAIDGKEIVRGQASPVDCYVMGDVQGLQEYIRRLATDPVSGERAFVVSSSQVHLFSGPRTRVLLPEDLFERELKLTFQRFLNEIGKVLPSPDF